MIQAGLALLFGTSLILASAGKPAVKKGLAGKIVFLSDGLAEGGRIVVDDGLYVRATFDPRQACVAGVMLRSPKAKARKRPQGLVTYELVFLGTNPRYGCDETPPAGFEAEDMQAGLFLTVDGRGKPVAIQAVGYMYSQLFVREGETRAELLRVLTADNAEEVGRQAE